MPSLTWRVGARPTSLVVCFEYRHFSFRILLVNIFSSTLLLVFAGSSTLAAQTSLPLKHAPQPTTSAITTGDLMTRLYLIADDSMKGRQAGSEEHQKVTA